MLAHMTNPTETTQVYQVFIRATPEQIWEAITTPEFTARYFHGARITATPERLRSVGTDGSLWAPELRPEPASRVTWGIEPGDGGVCSLTVVHDRLEQSPKTAASVAGPGWMFVLSGLKTLLETGEPLSRV